MKNQSAANYSKDSVRNFAGLRPTLPKYYRQKFLLALLRKFAGKLKRTDMQKYLFLSQQEYSTTAPQYYFVPYKFGPFSFQAYADIRRMADLGILFNQDVIQMKCDSDYPLPLRQADTEALDALYGKYGEIKGIELVKLIYAKYPYYAVNSELDIAYPGGANPYLSAIPQALACFSMGYEGLTIDQYLDKLIRNNVKTVIDVRNNPVSMKYGFSKRTLANALANLKISYINLPDLGIRSEFRKCLKTGDDYQALFDEYEKSVLRNQDAAMAKIASEHKNSGRILLTCFEKDFRYCHRSRICALLENRFNIKTEHL